MTFASTFDTARNLVQLVIDGRDTGWSTATSVTVTRTVAGASPVPVRGSVAVAVVGGVLLSSDNEAPMDSAVTYAATAVGDDDPVALSGTVETTGAAWGLWVKVPGRADLNCRVPLRDFGQVTRQTQGGSWQVPGGQRVAESSGLAQASSTLEVATRTPGQLAALAAVLEGAPGGVVLLQTGQPAEPELPSGYYQVTSWSTSNPGRARSDVSGWRVHTLTVDQVAMPAGDATGFSGMTYNQVADRFATYQDLLDGVPTYLDLATGSY
ncbi:hypothetical protein GCM10025864_44560 [Luteimicrobium album]|uniref:Minor tail protein n=1 Tax=Luteimicrobium album TaxID=1054550 RepID=A0ABQ6HW87_9MICO|nr:hypothetical protein [Luteimicrobium album]GMA22291.1 hypothetical protein GCM10025864_00500 [Luteimicrobium album]GMA26697.1 hypothetical protein GCM10025864_44560 [Luteimicrobium album]